MSERVVTVEPGEAEDPRQLFARVGLDPSLAPDLGVLEVLGAGVTPGPGDLIYRCDWIIVRDETVVGLAALSDVTGSALTAALGEAVKQRLPGFRFVHLAGPRSAVVYDGGWPFDLQTHDPQTVVDRRVDEVRPWGAGDEVIREIHTLSAEVAGETDEVSQAWIWAGGTLPQLDYVRPLGTLVGGALAVRGLAKLIGWQWQP